MADRKHVEAKIDVKALSETGQFAGHASVFGNIDDGGDVVVKGAFQEMELTSDGHVRILNQHNMRDPIGKATVKQDEIGLAFDGQLLMELPSARNMYALMKAKIIDGMSIGFDVLEGGAEIMNSGVRMLKALKLYEISPVTFGMNTLARIESVKAATDFGSPREFEDHLRDVGGFSRNQAKIIVSLTWDKHARRRDVGAEAKELFQLVQQLEFKPARDAMGEAKALAELVKSL